MIRDSLTIGNAANRMCRQAGQCRCRSSAARGARSSQFARTPVGFDVIYVLLGRTGMSPDDLVEIEDIEVVGGDDVIEELIENAKNETVDEAAEEDIDETLSERLWGLTEMFPAWLRAGLSSTSTRSVSGVKYFYSFGRSALWVVFSSSVILMAPVIFEVERAQMDEMQKQQQRQILLGPNAAVGGGGQSHFPMPLPPTQSK